MASSDETKQRVKNERSGLDFDSYLSLDLTLRYWAMSMLGMRRDIEDAISIKMDFLVGDLKNKNLMEMSGTPASKTLSWHLASETSSAANGASNATIGSREFKPCKLTSEVFHLLAPEDTASSLPFSVHLQPNNRISTVQSFAMKDPLEVPKPLSAFKSFDNPHRELI